MKRVRLEGDVVILRVHDGRELRDRVFVRAPPFKGTTNVWEEMTSYREFLNTYEQGTTSNSYTVTDTLSWRYFDEGDYPIRGKDVLVQSHDGRLWVAAMCSWGTCYAVHYQSNPHEVNDVEYPWRWCEITDFFPEYVQ